jgi:hypothetical protein
MNICNKYLGKCIYYVEKDFIYIGGIIMLGPKEKIDFWLNIMIDHCTFFLLTLSSKEMNYINDVKQFQKIFINLDQKDKDITMPFIDEISNQVNKFIEFKKVVLKQLISNNIELNLPPTFVNHMINEAVEFYNELQKIKLNIKENPIAENLSAHKLWLPDAAGHASAIIATLDPTEVEEINKAKYFEISFNNLFIKVNELNKILIRTNFEDGNLKYFNKQVIYKITEFIDFLHDINSLRMQNSLLGYLNPLMPDHMIREEEYYLKNIMNLK